MYKILFGKQNYKSKQDIWKYNCIWKYVKVKYGQREEIYNIAGSFNQCLWKIPETKKIKGRNRVEICRTENIKVDQVW